MTAGNWVPELVAAAGGENLFGVAGAHSPWLSWDELVAADPDVIVAMPCGFDLARTRAEMRALAGRDGWRDSARGARRPRRRGRRQPLLQPARSTARRIGRNPRRDSPSRDIRLRPHGRRLALAGIRDGRGSSFLSYSLRMKGSNKRTRAKIAASRDNRIRAATICCAYLPHKNTVRACVAQVFLTGPLERIAGCPNETGRDEETVKA